MDILSKLPSIGDEAKFDKYVQGELFKTSNLSSGQIRRARVRRLNRQTMKARRRQIQQHFIERRELATIRGHLQAAGVIAYATTYQPAPQRVLDSVTWIIQRFAEAPGGVEQIEVTHEVVIDSLTSALNRYQHLTGQPATSLSPTYVLPVAVAA